MFVKARLAPVPAGVRREVPRSLHVLIHQHRVAVGIDDHKARGASAGRVGARGQGEAGALHLGLQLAVTR